MKDENGEPKRMDGSFHIQCEITWPNLGDEDAKGKRSWLAQDRNLEAAKTHAAEIALNWLRSKQKY